MNDTKPPAEVPLMFDAIAREFHLAHAPAREVQSPRADLDQQRHTLETAQHETLESAYRPGTPPAPGAYRTLNAIDVFDDGGISYIHREDQWDGERWVTQGGYVTVVGWAYL
jgi:hypothetical protein